VIVADIVRRSAPSVREHTVLTVAADALVESGLGSLPVLDADGLLTGVVSEGDLLRFVVGTRHEPASSPRTARRIPAGRLPPRRRRRDDSQPGHRDRTAAGREVARLFVRLPWRMLPVVRLGRLVGVVTRTDVVHALVGSGPPHRRAEPGVRPRF
jgi:CBS domain-containing protein